MTEDEKKQYPPMPSDEELFGSIEEMQEFMRLEGLSEEAARTGRAMGLI